MSFLTPKNNSQPLSVWTVQVFGMILLTVVVIVWIVQDRESTLLVGSAMALIGVSGIFELAVYHASKKENGKDPMENDK